MVQMKSLALERLYHRQRHGALFPAPFASAGLEDEGVGATECAAVGVLTPLALFEPLRRIGGFGFPLPDLGV